MSFVGVFSQTKFYAKGKKEAYVGQNYAITFVLENGNGKNFRFPKKYPGFELVGGPSQSSNYSWVNGKTTSSKSYTYYLQATKTGTFTIPSASVEVGNQSITTKPFKVVVKKLTEKQKQKLKEEEERRQAQNDPFGFFRRRQQPKKPQQEEIDNKNWKEQVSKNLYVKMYVDKSNPYVGEQVTLYLKLYQRMQTFQTQVTEMPEFKGFWVNDFELKTDKWQQEKVDGVWYHTMMINKYALFPQREGTFTLSPIKLATLVQLQTKSTGNSFWDQFYATYENKEYKFQSNSIKIKVKPLPEEGKPENFSGAVGTFRYTANLDSLNVQTGSAITLKTKISGTGNIPMIEAPQITFPEDFEVYDPEEKEYISKKHTKISGTKKYDYLFIPTKPGKYKIDSIPFSYFDLNTKKYKTVYSKEFNINVTPSADYSEDKIVENTENTLDKDIKNISSINDIDSYKEDKFINTKTFWALWASPALIFLLLLIGKSKLENYTPDIVGINKRRANKIALSKLKQASVFLKKNDKKAFYNEIVRALWDYVSLKLNIQRENLSKENIQEKLLEHNIDTQTAKDYIDLINKSEMAVYSPIGETEMQKDFDKAREIIVNVENEIA